MWLNNSRIPIDRREVSLFAQVRSSTSWDGGMPRDATASVVPHAQFANDMGPYGSNGISPVMSSYRTGVERCVVASRYSRSEAKRRPHLEQTFGKRPSRYNRTIRTTSSSVMDAVTPSLSER